jgi:hypothetical protein
VLSSPLGVWFLTIFYGETMEDNTATLIDGKFFSGCHIYYREIWDIRKLQQWCDNASMSHNTNRTLILAFTRKMDFREHKQFSSVPRQMKILEGLELGCMALARRT